MEISCCGSFVLGRKKKSLLLTKTYDFIDKYLNSSYLTPTGLRSAVGNVSGNRYESDCRSRVREFDPGRVPYFAESFKKGCCQLQAKVCARSTG